jgi:hypothetical protein
MNSLFIKIFSLLLLFFVVSTNICFAHGQYLYSQRQYVGENIIIVNYNLDPLKSGVAVTYNVRYYTLANGMPISLDNAVITFTKNDKTIDTLSLSPPANNVDVTFLYSFRSPGAYKMNIQLKQKGKQLAQASFPIVVQKGVETGFGRFFTSNTLGGFITGVSISVFWLLFGERLIQKKSTVKLLKTTKKRLLTYI